VFDVVVTLTVVGIAVQVMVMMALSHSKNHSLKMGHSRLMFFMVVDYLVGPVESEALVVVRLKGHDVGESSRTSLEQSESKEDEVRVRPREPALNSSKGNGFELKGLTRDTCIIYVSLA
jgi:hypothetical protein